MPNKFPFPQPTALWTGYANEMAKCLCELCSVTPTDPGIIASFVRLIKGSRIERAALASRLGTADVLLSLLFAKGGPVRNWNLAGAGIHDTATQEQVMQVWLLPVPLILRSLILPFPLLLWQIRCICVV